MSFRMETIAVAGAAVIRMLGSSWRLTWDRTEFVEEAREINPNYIYALWHNRLLPLTFAHRSRGVVALVSEHRDGEMIARAVERLGYGLARGSSTRGGARGARELLGGLEGGHDLCVTVDGPRGPVYKVKPGIIEIARQSGAPIVPITASASRFKAFRSWDRFQLPHPFARVRITHAKPITVPADAETEAIEQKRVELERALTRITTENDAKVRDGG